MHTVSERIARSRDVTCDMRDTCAQITTSASRSVCEAGSLVLRLVRAIICVCVFSLAMILACVLEGLTHVIRLVTKPVVTFRGRCQRMVA